MPAVPRRTVRLTRNAAHGSYVTRDGRYTAWPKRDNSGRIVGWALVNNDTGATREERRLTRVRALIADGAV